MTEKSQLQRSDKIEARINLLEYQFSQVMKALESIESKQDLIKGTLDTLRYVEVKEFATYEKEAEKKFASKDELRNNTRLLYWLLGLQGSIFLTVIATIIGLVIKK